MSKNQNEGDSNFFFYVWSLFGEQLRRHTKVCVRTMAIYSELTLKMNEKKIIEKQNWSFSLLSDFAQHKYINRYAN